MMTNAALDACCLIDLLATGHTEAILRAAGWNWQIPTAVQREVQHVRQYDPVEPGQFVRVPADLSPLIASGVLQTCGADNPTEEDRFVHYAALFRSDGEAMCLALAEQRGWVLATDDRKAIRVAQQAGLTVVSCPALIQRWADVTQPDPATLRAVLRDIQLLAQFSPNPTMPAYQWWIAELANAAS
jgi:hypothetical protein